MVILDMIVYLIVVFIIDCSADYFLDLSFGK